MLHSLVLWYSAHGNSEIPSDKGVLSLRGIGGPTPRNPEPALSGTGSSDGWVLGAQVLRDIAKGVMRPAWLVTAQQQPAWSRHGLRVVAKSPISSAIHPQTTAGERTEWIQRQGEGF
jgi:hypothetical protein